MISKVQSELEKIGQQAKLAARELARATSEQKNLLLQKVAEAIAVNKAKILTVNKEEVESARAKQLTPAFIDRLALNDGRIESMISGINTIMGFPDPVGIVKSEWTVPTGLNISRVSIPLGTIAIIYEARPNVTVDAAILCLKSGNTVILRGGSECEKTNRLLVSCLQEGLKAANLPATCVQYVPTQDRAAVSELLQMNQYIDVVVPRGGKSLIERVMNETRIPVFQHLEGLCHTYIHCDADLMMAVDVVSNAKLRRPGICGATETLLIDEAIAEIFLPKIIADLQQKGCEVRGDERVQQIMDVKPANEMDWKTEYLEPILSVKVVADMSGALAHINQYSSGHTDAIITSNVEAAEKFKQTVNSAIVMHNCSTQFADGGEFGLGAEIGIATGKLHARGPVSLEELTTYKYVVEGSGQTRA